MSSAGSGSGAWRWTALGLVVAGLLAWWILSFGPAAREPVAKVEIAAPPAPAAHADWVPRPERPPTPGCAPQASRTCVQGDSWWVDGCGVVYELADDCDLRRCRDGECEAPIADACGNIPVPGVCDGDIARVCDAGRAIAIDCGLDGRRCVATQEGPVCRAPSPDDCEASSAARCEGDVLTSCIDGRWTRTDCRRMAGQCVQQGGHAACLVVGAQNGEEDCGACGCPLEPTDEVCNGRDDDGDGSIDEGVDCGPVDIVAFIVVDDDGRGEYERTDVEAEVDHINAALARQDELGLSFRLADVVAVRSPDWIELDAAEIQAIVASGLVHPARDDFYVPIVFTDTILVEEVPRPGLSTVPNGFCGGVRRTTDPQSPVGLVAIARRRWATTGAHEVGHFLGLCHTHGDHVEGVTHTPAVEDAPACEEACAREADGLCDTPPDAGPPSCRVDAQCVIGCEDGGRPDPTNMMAYYPECRAGFSEEQMLLMRRTLWLRRQWHPCVWGDGCACEPLGPRCPEGMTCRQIGGDGEETTWGCGLDGASVPGGVCTSNLDCTRNAVCVAMPPEAEPRCSRPCDETTPDCDCHEIAALGLSLCVDDLVASAAEE